MDKHKRTAGILLHISSLSSSFGVGDLGPKAKLFADFLKDSGQSLWQLLPINPIEEGQGWSPYSSTSSSAGNILFISPEVLAEEGLLDAAELKKWNLPQTGKADYAAAQKAKTTLLQKAWLAYLTATNPARDKAFQQFCKDEQYWLHDFALFTLLKAINENKPWYEWPDEYRLRKTNALDSLTEDHEETIQKIKWFQFVFMQQWNALHLYCRERGISLVGDISFYVSHDSADVWAHKSVFAINKEGQKTGVAGTPPDAFSDDGQLWGMPVFKWGALKKRNYDWWIQRLKKNKALFDIVRLDHFRAFSAYWDVPGGDDSARDGKWKKGPGADFFYAVQEQLGDIDFIAEDLGHIDESVTSLMDEFSLPGMKILQFTFGEDVATSVYTPHNYPQNSVAYTGTHDNNTTLGWYRKETDEARKKRIEAYLGQKVKPGTIVPALIRLAYASVARIAIIQMQDVLGLDEKARMNLPGPTPNNWQWRLKPGQITQKHQSFLLELVKTYSR